MSQPPERRVGDQASRAVLLGLAKETVIEVLIDEARVASGGRTPPAIVLLPSSMRDAHDLQALASRLADAGFCVLRPQPPGMGGSTAPTTDLTLYKLAHDVAQTVKVLGNGRAIVAGHAWGHFVARVTDLEHPQCVRGVVVMAGAARTFPAGLTQALDIAADAAQPRGLRLAALQRAFFAPGHDASPWLDGWHPHLQVAFRKASQTPDKNTWWPVSHAPILDLQGACDPWRPEATRLELRDTIGDTVTVQVIADASHALPSEQPAAVAAAIVEWARLLPT